MSESRIPKTSMHKVSGKAVVRLRSSDHYLGPWKSKIAKVEYLTSRFCREVSQKSRKLGLRKDDHDNIMLHSNVEGTDALLQGSDESGAAWRIL